MLYQYIYSMRAFPFLVALLICCAVLSAWRTTQTWLPQANVDDLKAIQSRTSTLSSLACGKKSLATSTQTSKPLVTTLRQSFKASSWHITRSARSVFLMSRKPFRTLGPITSSWKLRWQSSRRISQKFSANYTSRKVLHLPRRPPSRRVARSTTQSMRRSFALRRNTRRSSPRVPWNKFFLHCSAKSISTTTELSYGR